MKAPVAMQAVKFVSDKNFQQGICHEDCFVCRMSISLFALVRPDAATTTVLNVRSPRHVNHNAGLYLLDTVAYLLRG